MPAKRRIIDRPRRATFTPEVLQSFIALERTPMCDRRSDAFKDKDRELARRLGLEMEFICDCRSVLDRAPPFARATPVHDGQHRVHAVRLALLAAIANKAAPVPADRRVAGAILA
jgi:hypothetical protein